MDKFEILKLLQNKKNILLTGAPGTGKSRLMNEVALEFEHPTPRTPVHLPEEPIPIPQEDTHGPFAILNRTHKRIFRTTLHQNYKYRDFLTGIIPSFDNPNEFQVTKGILYEANEFAKQNDSAALLIIDELNRGPAIEIFGGSIVAIEADKRLSTDNTATSTTQYFQILDPLTHNNIEYALSPNLYILAAMNQADVSVAPLDVAFLRRWMSIKLEPDYKSLYNKFDIIENSEINFENPTIKDIYHIAINALQKINNKIKAGRGPEYQLGQGIFLSTNAQNQTIEGAYDFILECWSMIYTHIEELFFGDINAIGYMINVNKQFSPYSLEEVTFAGETKNIITHTEITRDTIFKLYRSLLEDN